MKAAKLGAANARIEERIRKTMADLRPLLHIENLVLELVEFRPSEGLAVLRIEGGCADCEMDGPMLLRGIEAHLRSRVPEVREVHAAESVVGTTPVARDE